MKIFTPEGLLLKQTLTHVFCVQIEWDSATGSTSWYRIKWLDKCTYQAELIKTDDDSEVILHDLTLIVEITKTIKNTFQYKVHLKGTDVYDEGEMKKIRTL